MASESKQPSSKPFTPSLSSKFRGTKANLTPRLAGSASTPHSPASASRHDAVVRSAVVQPSARTPTLATPTPRPTSTSISPTLPRLNGNITPRSGARRKGPESPATPGSVARATKSPPKAAFAPSLAISNSISNSISSAPWGNLKSHADSMHTPNSIRSPPPTRTDPRRLSGARRAAGNDEGKNGKFIRAQAATIRSVVSSGRMPGRAAQSGTAPKPLLTAGTESALESTRDRKFFHASDVRVQLNRRSAPGAVSQSREPAVSPILSRLPSVETPQPVLLATRATVPAVSSKRLPRVPLKSTTPTFSTTSIRPPVSPVLARSSTTRSLSSIGRPSISSNIDTASQKSGPILDYAKGSGASLLTVTSTVLRYDQPLTASPEKSPFISLSPNTISSRSVSLESSSFATSVSEQLEAHKFPEGPKLSGDVVPAGTAASVLAPPFEPSAAPSEPPKAQNEAAATARRDRKVLDLEISNSSLLAINKTLERELRKQTVELRRFRRLTRSGKLSFAPANRTVSSSTLGTVPETFDGDEDFDSEQDEEGSSDVDDEDDDDDDDLSANSKNDPDSPTHKANRRARDDRRLLLNLSRHQKMLVDSQKLTQSIRRCLTCTEELIQGANKAINYQVGIGDVKLGGRVLSADELEYQSAEADREEYYSRSQHRGVGLPSSSPCPDPATDFKPPRQDEKIFSVAVERLFQELLSS